MRRTATVVLFLLGLVLRGEAQDFKKVVDIVVDMEASLKKMIATETADRKASTDSLRIELAGIRTSIPNTSAENSPVLENLDSRIGTLERRLDELKANSDLRSMSGELSSLITELKKAIDESRLSNKQLSPPAGTTLLPFKLGFLAQVYGQALQEQATAIQDATRGYEAHWQRQLFVRRLRFLLGGDIIKNTSFFLETDAPNIGKVETSGLKSTKISMYIQDAYLQQTFAPEFSVIAGLQLVGISRNSLQSASSLMALDYGTYQFLTSTPFDNTAGRDLGVNFKGFVMDERLEYRIGFFSGKNINLYSPLRTVARFNYAFEDREKGLFYTGTTLAKGKLLSLGGGLDLQGSYRAASIDGIVDLPYTDAGSFTASGSCSYFDGGGSNSDSTFFTGAIPRQIVLYAEAGYFFKEQGLQPYVKFESDAVDATVSRQVGATSSTLDLQNKLRSKSRYGLGLNYYLSGHNASIKILYELASRYRQSLDPSKAEIATTSEISLQLQYFSF